MYKEHRTIPFKQRESAPKNEMGVFDDKYQCSPPDFKKIDKKFQSQYVNGNLKSNIVFDDEAVRITF